MTAKRSTVNFVIDALTFAFFVFLVATGFILYYVLPAGSGRIEGGGPGQGAAVREITLLWGLDRHQWGEIHFWLAAAILILLSFHLALHWRWIVAVVRGRRGEGSGARAALGAVGALGILMLAVMPFLSPSRDVPRGELKPGGEAAARTGAFSPAHDDSIRGSMTLKEVEAETGVSADELVRHLGLPPATPLNENLGRLRKQHGLTMEQVREAVYELKKKKD
jgi:hypothetical protein